MILQHVWYLMTPTRHKRGIRGITPIFSTLILLGMTVFAMIIVVGYSQDIIAHQSAQMGERLVVEKVFFEPNQIVVWARNIGHGDLTITEALVNGVFYTFTPTIRLPSPDGNPTAIATQITIPGSYTPGVYRISLFTLRGNKLGVVEVDYS
jgi:hypothetical protein